MPLFSLLWAVWTLIDEAYVRTMDGMEPAWGWERISKIRPDCAFLHSSLRIMHFCCTVPLGRVTHVRVRRRYAQVLLSSQASVCPSLFNSLLLVLKLLVLNQNRRLSIFNALVCVSVLTPCELLCLFQHFECTKCLVDTVLTVNSNRLLRMKKVQIKIITYP